MHASGMLQIVEVKIMDENKLETVSVVQAASELGLTPDQLHLRMQYGVLPIGEVFRRKHCKRYQYTIYRGLLDKYKRYLSGED